MALTDERKQKLIQVARFIEEHIDEKVTLAQLSDMVCLSSSRLQRAFKELFGLSPKEYQDAIRMGKFKSLLKGESTSVTDAVYASGFGSISRIYGEDSRSMGMTPKTYKADGFGETIHYAIRKTVLGYMLMAATDTGVCAMQFADEKENLYNLLKGEFPKAELILSNAQDTPNLDMWINALDKHLSHGAPKPDVPLDIRGTVFQQKVWLFLLSIKEGEFKTYAEVAKQINNPKAVRAVGIACGKNRIGILIPCHRVLRGDGGLGGYRWGVERKQALINHELEAIQPKE